MARPDFEAEEQVFTSAEVCHVAGISHRQLQWWDERGVVSPSRKDHRREYLSSEVLQVLVVAALRGKGLSLQKTRRVLRLLRRDLSQHIRAQWASDSGLYLVTDCQTVHLDDDPQLAVNRLAEAKKPMYLVSLSGLIQRITAEKQHRHKETRQLQLF